jgi:hypothetical protein
LNIFQCFWNFADNDLIAADAGRACANCSHCKCGPECPVSPNEIDIFGPYARKPPRSLKRYGLELMTITSAKSEEAFTSPISLNLNARELLPYECSAVKCKKLE